MTAPYTPPLPPVFGQALDWRTFKPPGDVPRRWQDTTSYQLPYQAQYLGDLYGRAQGLVQRGPYAGSTYAQPSQPQINQLWGAAGYGYGPATQPYQQAARGFLANQLTGQTPVGDFSGTAPRAIPWAMQAAQGAGVASAPYQWLGQSGAGEQNAVALGQRLNDPYRGLTNPAQSQLSQMIAGQAAYGNPYATLQQPGTSLLENLAGGRGLSGPYTQAPTHSLAALQNLASGRLATENPYQRLQNPAMEQQIATARGVRLDTPYDQNLGANLWRENEMAGGAQLRADPFRSLSGQGQQGQTVAGQYLGGGGYAGATGAQRALEQRTLGGQEFARDPFLGQLGVARAQQGGTIGGQRATQNWATPELAKAQTTTGSILGSPTREDPFFAAARPGIQQLSATAAGQATNPYLDRLFGAQSRAVTEAYNRTVLPQIETRFAQAGRLGSGAYEGARGQAEDELATNLRDLAGDVYGRGFEAERGRQLEAGGQLAQMGLQGYGAERGLEAELARSNLGLFGDVYQGERGLQEQAAQAREALGATEYGRERGFQQEMGLAGLERGADLYSRERALQEQAAAGRQGLGFESFRAERGAQDAAREAMLQRASGLYGQERGFQEAAGQFGGGLGADIYQQGRDLQAQAAQFGYGTGADAYARERESQRQAAQFGVGTAADVYENERQRAAQAAQFGYGTSADAYARERQAQDAAAQFGLGSALDVRGQERGFQEGARESMLDRSLQAQLAEQQYGLQALGYAPQLAEMERANLGFGMDTLAQEQAYRQASMDDAFRRYQMPWDNLGLYQQAIGLPFEYAQRGFGWVPNPQVDSGGDGGGGFLGGLF